MNQERYLTNWHSLLARGLLAIAFGILAIAFPGLTLGILVFLFAGYALVEGVVNIAGAIRARKDQPQWWVLLLEGLVSVAAGLMTAFWPGITAVALVYVIAAWAVMTGVLKICAAIRLRKQIEGEWLLGLSGVLSIVLGVFLMSRPGVGALAVVVWIGLYAIMFGVMLIALSFRVRPGRADEMRGPPAGISHEPHHVGG